jgi:hypothetical protein
MKFGLASYAEDEQGDAGTVSAVEGRLITRLDSIKVLRYMLFWFHLGRRCNGNSGQQEEVIPLGGE